MGIGVADGGATGVDVAKRAGVGVDAEAGLGLGVMGNAVEVRRANRVKWLVWAITTLANGFTTKLLSRDHWRWLGL